MKSIFVAVPAYDRKITCETARALINEEGAAVHAGVDLQVGFAPGNSLVHIARDHLVRDFLASNCDRLVFVDDDVTWELGQLLLIGQHNTDFVGGCYRYKDPVEDYPIAWLDKPFLQADPETGLLEVASLPGGFLSISRKAIEQLWDAYPNRNYQFHGQDFHAFFYGPPGGGEDGAFCAEWRALGGKVWLDPELTLTHVDEAGHKYVGCIGAWLKARPMPEEIMKAA